jgi:hypothetical protein
MIDFAFFSCAAIELAFLACAMIELALCHFLSFAIPNFVSPQHTPFFSSAGHDSNLFFPSPLILWHRILRLLRVRDTFFISTTNNKQI